MWVDEDVEDGKEVLLDLDDGLLFEELRELCLSRGCEKKSNHYILQYMNDQYVYSRIVSIPE